MEKRGSEWKEGAVIAERVVMIETEIAEGGGDRINIEDTPGIQATQTP
ncbi:hypothetical protein [Natrialba magadii]|nr:hypothetical protein [Natrialba magadii]